MNKTSPDSESKPDYSSALAFDLNNDGIRTTKIVSGVHFDYNTDGFAERSTWLSSTNGFLVRDQNHNEKIDNGCELFGNNTLLTSGQKAPHGFAAMSELDSNHDNSIDTSDPAFSDLLIWKDTDGDGKASPGELLPLNECGIASISLSYTKSDILDSHGNMLKHIGFYIDLNGQIHSISDVWFLTDNMNTEETNCLAIPRDILSLPYLPGYGNIRNLHQAMVRDKSLAELVISFGTNTHAVERHDITQQIIFKWAGVELIDPKSRANAVFGNTIGDARKLEALEKFVDKKWTGLGINGEQDPNPNAQAATLILQAYDKMTDMVYGHLLRQTHCESLENSIIYAWDGSILHGDLSKTTKVLTKLMAENSVYAKDIFIEFLKYHSFKNAAYEAAPFISKLEPLDPDLISMVKSALSIKGGTGNDSLQGSVAGDIILGFAGDDILIGNAGNDLLEGGTANDILYGNSGVDEYCFNKGDGHDILYDDYREDVCISLMGLELKNLIFKRTENDLVIHFKDNEQNSIKLNEYFSINASSANLIIKSNDGIATYNSTTQPPLTANFGFTPLLLTVGICLAGLLTVLLRYRRRPTS